MQSTEFIITSVNKTVGKITLNRPEVHNALHIKMIREISHALDTFNELEELRVIIIDGNGENFSAGADLKWMRSGITQSTEELEHESKELAMLFHKIHYSKKIIILALQGKVIGGANGIVAASDIVIAASDASFAFTEVKLGLIPATIAPYVIRKSGERSKEWMLTGRQISSEEALINNLVHFVVKKENLGQKTEDIKQNILAGGPDAIRGIKELFLNNKLQNNPDDLVEFTSRMIAKYRTSAEGQEGISAFFDKRKPKWVHES